MNMNQFEMNRERGEIEQNQPFGGRVMTMVVSANQATALAPGDFVKFDTSITYNPGMPQIVAAAVGDTLTAGCIVFSLKKSSFVAGDLVEVAMPDTVVILTAGATINVGADLEDTGSSTVQTKSAQAKRGRALDYAVSGQKLRVLIRDY
jgi:hypothetical protein